jgi:AcrR family transcriptional regulator
LNTITATKTEAGKAATDDRRTTGVQQTGRAAKVVASVLKATGEELNRVGYANLKVEEVAARAGVNKTTIYRRWPNKAILVSETLDSHFQRERPMPDTGSLRGDFTVYLTNMVSLSKAAIWRGVLTALAGRTDPEVEAIARKLYLRERAFRTSMVQRAIDRGDFPRGVDAELIGDMCSAPILRRLLTFGEKVEAQYVDAVIDIALTGSAVAAVKNSGAA